MLRKWQIARFAESVGPILRDFLKSAAKDPLQRSQILRIFGIFGFFRHCRQKG